MSPKQDPAVLNANRRMLECILEFEELAEHASDNIPADAQRRHYDAMGPLGRLEALVIRKRAQDAAAKRAPESAEVRTCKGCFEDFEVDVHARGPVPLYCSRKCAKKAARRRKATRAERCGMCGKPLNRKANGRSRRHCGDACKQKHYRCLKNTQRVPE